MPAPMFEISISHFDSYLAILLRFYIAKITLPHVGLVSDKKNHPQCKSESNHRNQGDTNMPEHMLTNKVATITGGGSGIGEATAKALALEGASVVVTDINGDAASAVADAINSAGGNALGMRVDVTVESDAAAMVAAAQREFGSLDCAVNCAGVSDAPVSFTDMTLEAWNRMLAVALTGVFLCLKHELATISRPGGSIVNVSSGAGFTPAPGQPHYTAAKHGVLGITKCAARDYVGEGIRVNAICPGMTDTPMLREHFEQAPDLLERVAHNAPSGRLALPEEMADIAVWLCSDRSSYVSGESIIVDLAGLCR